MTWDPVFVITVDVHLIERGDRLLWQAGVIDHVEFVDGRWLLVDEHGTVLTTRPIDARVQVYRDGSQPDDCAPHGISRLTEVRR